MDQDAAAKTSVHPARLEEVPAPAEPMRNLLDANLDKIHGVKVRLTMSVGGAQLSIGELLALKDGATLKLDKGTAEPIDILLDDKLLARGELMVADDNFAVRITEIGGG